MAGWVSSFNTLRALRRNLNLTEISDTFLAQLVADEPEQSL